MPRYWLDANVLIEAHRRSNPIGIAVSFWAWLATQVEGGIIVCPRSVYQEIAEQEDHRDEVARWVQNRKEKGLCVPPTREVTAHVGVIMQYVFEKYLPQHAYEFGKGGDAWVIGHALDDGGTVVTQESELHPDAKKARIPDVCRHFDVRCVNTVEMLRLLKAKF
jgi:hypothetical protein